MKRFLAFWGVVCLAQLLRAETSVIVGRWANGEIVEEHAVFARQDTVRWNVAAGTVSEPVWHLEAKDNDGSYKLLETVVSSEYELSIDTNRLHCNLFHSLEQLPAVNDSSVYFQARVTVEDVADGVNVCDTFPFYLNLLPERGTIKINSCDTTLCPNEEWPTDTLYHFSFDCIIDRVEEINIKRLEYCNIPGWCSPDWLMNSTIFLFDSGSSADWAENSIRLMYQILASNAFGTVESCWFHMNQIVKSFVFGNPTTSLPVAKNSGCYVYPNPADDVLFLSSVEGVKAVCFLDATGRVVKKIDCPEQKMDVSTLIPGVYYAFIYSVNDKIIDKFTIIKK